MPRRTHLLPLAAALALLAAAAPARATVMVELSLDDLVRAADVIVVGTVRASRARLVTDAAQGVEPRTFTELAVRERIAGPPGDLVIVERGGTLQGETLRFDGTPEYTPGEEVVVFLERRPDGSLRTMGMAQGKLTIHRGVGGAPDVVRRDLGEIAFASWGPDGMQVAHASSEAVELGAFLDTVRGLAGVLR